jgi:hypothetical protein
MHAMTISGKSERQSILTDAELEEIAEELSTYFPRPIAETLITLMEVDPHTIHAYWNIEPSRMEHIPHTAGNDGREGALTLRVYKKRLDAKNCGNGFVDYAIQGMQSSTYINAIPQSPYVAEIGLLRPDGDFLVLAISNEVITPPDHRAHRRPVPNDTQDNEVPARQNVQNAEAISDKLFDACLTHFDETDTAAPLSVFTADRERRESDKGGFYTGSEHAAEGLDVHVEIRAFGRVNPVKGLTIAGENITIRPDGSFNHRIPFKRKEKEKMVSLLKVKLDETMDD